MKPVHRYNDSYEETPLWFKILCGALSGILILAVVLAIYKIWSLALFTTQINVALSLILVVLAALLICMQYSLTATQHAKIGISILTGLVALTIGVAGFYFNHDNTTPYVKKEETENKDDSQNKDSSASSQSSINSEVSTTPEQNPETPADDQQQPAEPETPVENNQPVVDPNATPVPDWTQQPEEVPSTPEESTPDSTAPGQDLVVDSGALYYPEESETASQPSAQ